MQERTRRLMEEFRATAAGHVDNEMDEPQCNTAGQEQSNLSWCSHMDVRPPCRQGVPVLSQRKEHEYRHCSKCDNNRGDYQKIERLSLDMCRWPPRAGNTCAVSGHINRTRRARKLREVRCSCEWLDEDDEYDDGTRF